MDSWKQIGIAITWASALFMIISCEKTTVQNPSDEICLRLVEQKTTKAGSSSTPPAIVFPHSTFGLFANYTPDRAGTPTVEAWAHSDYWESIGPEFEKGHPDALFLNNYCFSNQVPDGDGHFVGVLASDITQHLPQYWPAAGSLIFAAYAPHQSQAQEIQSIRYENAQSSERMGVMTIDVLLKPNTASTTPESALSFDLLHCRPIVEDQNEFTYGRQEAPVNLQFKHAMSKVTFNISDPVGEYHLADVKLMYCINSALFHSGTEENTGWLPDFQDKDHALTIDYDLLTSPTHNLVGNTHTIDLIVIPLQLNGIYETVQDNIDQPVQLALTIQNDDGVGKTVKIFDLSALPEPAPKNWKRGMHYTYNISVQTHKIEFDTPIVNLWDVNEKDI